MKNIINNKRNIAVFIIILFLVVGAFYGGMKYKEGKKIISQGNFQNFTNLTPEQQKARIQQFGGNFSGMGQKRAQGGFLSGSIISKDDKSIIVKLNDGSSKIIFYSGTTEILKLVNGITDDLEVGENVNINGNPNSDGSITAQSIQVRSGSQK